MQKTPKSLRLQIGLFGRTNVGKSSFLNMVANQDVSITSETPGTTTDVVEKSMELLPIGPVTFLDTGGIDDFSELSKKRLQRTMKVIDRAEVSVIIIEPNKFTEYEEKVADELKKAEIPFIIAVNKIDSEKPGEQFIEALSKYSKRIVLCSAIDKLNRDDYVNEFKNYLLEILPKEYSSPPPLIRDLLPKQGLAIMLIPIDKEAPKGRLILPQVQTIRDILDGGGISIMVKESEYEKTLNSLSVKPDLVVCDSQVVDFMVENTSPNVACTTFSILFSRYKGELTEQVKGAAALTKLKRGDKILIAEACSHHPNEEDIGRVKIPRWLKNFTGFEPKIDVFAGRDYPDNLNEYKAVIHCGGCMLTRNEMLVRLRKAKLAEVPITNYGVAISLFQGILDRVIEPFPEALKEFKRFSAK